MAEKLKSEGVCYFCKERFSKSVISKHLAKHLSELEKTNAYTATIKYCHLEAQVGLYFLHFLVIGSAKMQDVDNFLRSIWLECCGHMSAFTGRSEIGMKRKLHDVFLTNEKLSYEYDFGSTTELLIKKHQEYALPLTGPILLMSRNEPLKLMCSLCGKNPATVLCSVCLGEEEALFCDDCAPKHAESCPDFEDYAEMPVVNSPRMGVCGYDGGSVDVERDGVYQPYSI